MITLNPAEAANRRINRHEQYSRRDDNTDYHVMLGNMVERIERAKDPQRRYVWDMRERLAFRGLDLLEAYDLRYDVDTRIMAMALHDAKNALEKLMGTMAPHDTAYQIVCAAIIKTSKSAPQKGVDS